MKLLTILALALSIAACGGSASPANHPQEPSMTDTLVRGSGDSSTLGSIITFKVKPESEQAFVDFAADIVKRVYEQEPGTLTYTMFKHPTEPSTYVMIERYRDAAAMDAHMASKMMAEVGEKLPGWLAAAPEQVEFKQLLPR